MIFILTYLAILSTLNSDRIRYYCFFSIGDL